VEGELQLKNACLNIEASAELSKSATKNVAASANLSVKNKANVIRLECA